MIFWVHLKNVILQADDKYFSFLAKSRALMERKQCSKYCFLIIYLLWAGKPQKPACSSLIFIWSFMSYLIFFKKKLKEDRGRGEISHIIHTKNFIDGFFFPQFSAVDSKKMSITLLAITAALFFSLQFQKSSVHFSCLKKIIVDIEPAIELRLISRFYIHLDSFYVCQNYCGFTFIFLFTIIGLYCHSSCFMWKGTWSAFFCFTACVQTATALMHAFHKHS